MPENNGVAETFVNSLSTAIGSVSGKKNGIAAVGMGFVYLLKDGPWQLCALVAGLAGLPITYQFILDTIERLWLKKDLPSENGNGSNGGTVSP